MSASEEKRVRIEPTHEPHEDAPPRDSDWVEVTIELTDQQRADLKKAGVDTPHVKIRTYDLGRLGPGMAN